MVKRCAVNDYARHLDMEEALAELLRLIRVPEDGSDQSYLTAAMERARSLLTEVHQEKNDG